MASSRAGSEPRNIGTDLNEIPTAHTSNRWPESGVPIEVFPRYDVMHHPGCGLFNVDSRVVSCLSKRGDDKTMCPSSMARAASAMGSC